MILSNSARSFIACVLILLAIQGCKWWPKDDAGNSRTTTDTKGEIPFSTTEPEVFQCEIVRSDGEHEQKTFFARKNGYWRFDLSDSVGDAETVIRTDKYYRVRHDKKSYVEVPQGDTSANEPEFLSDLTFSALKLDGHAKYDKIGTEGGITKYSVKIGDTDSAKALIYVDEKIGLVIKEEFFSLKGQTEDSPEPSFIFELRNVKQEVDDSVFAIPAGYKKLSWGDYIAQLKKSK